MQAEANQGLGAWIPLLRSRKTKAAQQQQQQHKQIQQQQDAIQQAQKQLQQRSQQVSLLELDQQLLIQQHKCDLKQATELKESAQQQLAMLREQAAHLSRQVWAFVGLNTRPASCSIVATLCYAPIVQLAECLT